jgi:hypothetical protein
LKKKKNQILIENVFGSRVEREYLSEMFSWIVKGSKEYYKGSKIEMTTEFKNRTIDIIQGADSIKSFFDRHIIFTKEESDRQSISELILVYLFIQSEHSVDIMLIHDLPKKAYIHVI